METQPQSSRTVVQQFQKHWEIATDDNNLTLHGFRRFKTTHLLNLRYLEDEIAELDHIIYQAGLSLGLNHTPTDRLGLSWSKKDQNVPSVEVTMTRELVLKLRNLLQQYDEALTAFHNVMSMETFSLLDDEKQSSLRSDLTLYETYKTRLLRLDLGTRSRTDPFQRQLHKYIRAFRYWKLSTMAKGGDVEARKVSKGGHRWSYQNTIRFAEIIGRIITAIIAAIFLIVPLIILSYQSSKNIQLIIVSSFIVVFSFLVGIMLKISNLETMAVAAAYAAVIVTFVSNVG
ncbi:hypothetical protein EV127DRAFT_497834 [Xylaria flabelliformis]|nr:hypothetical protein EV127DRAFT_497834 [Xylaria flabelliformis]KAI0859045.1 hypothetical protein F4860DRAFT_526581 [Xylaria cubensis]